MKFEYYAGNGYVSNLSEPPIVGIAPPLLDDAVETLYIRDMLTFGYSFESNIK